MKRVAAIDYGRRRIGIAVADPLGIIVRGHETITRSGSMEVAAKHTADSLAEFELRTVVVGLPLHSNGDESDMSREVRAFVALLRPLLSDIDVVLQDESLTSWSAEESLKARGVSLKEARLKGLIDQESAVCILREWLRRQGATE